MKTFTVAAVFLALVAVPAYAQRGGGGPPPQTPQEAKEARDKKADEKAYNSALQRIPDSKEKYDPWGVARPAEPAKEPAGKSKQAR
jgi:hypothetical protein